MKTYAPSSEANRCAVARPMPLFPPVMTATFPSSRFVINSVCAYSVLILGTYLPIRFQIKES
jgi:hypothetical protein